MLTTSSSLNPKSIDPNYPQMGPTQVLFAGIWRLLVGLSFFWCCIGATSGLYRNSGKGNGEYHNYLGLGLEAYSWCILLLQKTVATFELSARFQRRVYLDSFFGCVIHLSGVRKHLAGSGGFCMGEKGFEKVSGVRRVPCMPPQHTPVCIWMFPKKKG